MNVGGKIMAERSFSVLARNLKEAVTRVKHVLPAKVKTENKIGEYVLLYQKGKELDVQASGLGVQACFSVGIYLDRGASNEVRIAVPYKSLLGFLKRVGDDEMLLCTPMTGGNGEPCLLVEGYYVNHIFQGVDASEYPQFLEVESNDDQMVEVDVLKEAISQTTFAADDSSALGLDGVYFEFEADYANIVATNRHILSLYRREFFFICPPRKNFFVPVQALRAFMAGISGLNMGREAVVRISEHRIQIEYADFRLSSPLMDRSFPDYRKVIPVETSLVAILERGRVCKVIKSLLLSADKKLPRLDLAFANNSLTIFVKDERRGMSDAEKMTCNYAGDAFEVSFNGKFLLRILENLKSERVVMKMVSSKRPVVIQPDPEYSTASVLCLIMPMLKGE